METVKNSEDEKPTNDVEPVKAQKSVVTKSSKSSMMVLLIILLLVVGAGAYWWRDMRAKSQAKDSQANITSLQQRVTDLEKQLAEEKDKVSIDTKKTSETPTATVPSATMIANIKAVFASGNSAALEGYMAGKVNVIIAASECCGDKTPAQATAEITSFMSGATDPWNFALPTATLTNYQSGDYAQYFPANAVVGKSNDMVISFTFNSAGKISGVFWTTVESLL